MPRSRPAPRAGTRKRPAPRRPINEQLGSSRAMRIGVIAFAMLLTCSLLAGTLVLIPFDELFGLNDAENAENIPNPNEDVIEDQMAVVEENPDDIDAVLLLANILGNSGRLDEAIPYYEQAIDLAPEDASIRLDFARALADGDLKQDAELQFQRVVEMDPDSQEALYYLAELYMSWEPPRTEDARSLYEQSIGIDPDSFIAQQAQDRLSSIGATPSAGASPQATPAAEDGTPTGDGTGG